MTKHIIVPNTLGSVLVRAHIGDYAAWKKEPWRVPAVELSYFTIAAWEVEDEEHVNWTEARREAYPVLHDYFALDDSPTLSAIYTPSIGYVHDGRLFGSEWEFEGFASVTFQEAHYASALRRVRRAKRTLAGSGRGRAVAYLTAGLNVRRDFPRDAWPYMADILEAAVEYW